MNAPEDPEISQYKKAAASRAVDFLQPGMIVGLGHGSTAAFAVDLIAQLLHAGRLKDILCIPCSSPVEKKALALGIPLTTLEEHPVIDMTIDGTDEADHDLNLIKGGGGALLREKIVAQASRREVIVADDSKLSDVLGTRSALPVEVATFGLSVHKAFIESLGASGTIRSDKGRIYRTDHGNAVIDCRFPGISDPFRLDQELKRHAGIVEHGLFLGLATDLILAGPAGIRNYTAGRKVHP
jgi:ribose 5-phosphate isomerase A